MKKILCIDNRSVAISQAQAAAKGFDQCELRCVPDGLDLYHEAEANPPDLLVIDLLMPSMHGLAVTRLLKFHEDLRHVPVMIVASTLSDGQREEAVRCGADDYWDPSQAPDQIAEAMKELLKNS